jgi:phospholipid/cholesterol/gamma-HCH transport system substrate-binding protein
VPGLCGASGTPTAPLPTPSLPTVPVPSLPTITLPGLPRPGAYADPPDPRRGPTLGQLSEIYDPALVSLLVPGMVVER